MNLARAVGGALVETVTALRRRWRASLGTSIGVLLGVAGLVAIISIGESSSLRTTQRLNEYSGNLIELFVGNETYPVLTERQLRAQASQVPGLIEIGMFEQQAQTASVGRVARSSVTATLIVASGKGVRLSGAKAKWGSVADCLTACDPSAVALGEQLAQALGVTADRANRGALMEGRRVLVTAALSGGPSGLESALVVTPTAAQRLALDVDATTDVYLVEVAAGTGNSVSQHLPLAARPEDPTSVWTEGVPDPAVLRGRLSEDSRLLGVGLSVVMVLSGLASVANAFAAAVVERRSEIAIRRAMGTSRRHIAGLFVLEAVVLGTLSGVFGFSAGLAGAHAVVASLGWTFATPWWIIMLPCLGILVGVLAALYPAWKATRVDPAVVLQSA